jgi:hypothetical protein
MRPLLEAFLRSGGNVVVCGAQGAHLDWLRRAGLIDLEQVGTVDGQRIQFTREGGALGRGIAPFLAMNATTAYAGAGATVLAETEGKAAVAIGRRVGRGWVICIGLDYYSTNDGASQMLANAIQLR